MALHKNLTGDDIHRVYTWEYADNAARLAATGFLAGDIGKLCRVLISDEIYMLTDDSPITWHRIDSGNGDVTGPSGATDNALARYDGATGKLLQNSLVTVDDTGNLSPTDIASQWSNIKDPTGFVDKSQSTISFNESTREFKIQPVSGSYYYYTAGVLRTKSSSDSVYITNSTALYFVYFDGTTLTATSTWNDQLIVGPWVLVAAIYWNSSLGKAVLFSDERHGASMSGRTHLYLHTTQSTRYGGGLALGDYVLGGDGSADAHARCSIANGSIWDEDLQTVITDGSPQELAPIVYAPVVYRDGTVWTKDVATSFPVKQGTRIKYNNLSGGAWSQPDATELYYVAMWIFAVPDVNSPIIAVLGQRQDSTLANALVNNRVETLDLTSFATTETKLIYRLIFQTSSGYANAPKCRLVDWQDYRSATAAAYVAPSHNTLQGRSDAEAHPASSVSADVTNFNGKLSSADTTVQKALDTLDNRGTRQTAFAEVTTDVETTSTSFVDLLTINITTVAGFLTAVGMVAASNSGANEWHMRVLIDGATVGSAGEQSAGSKPQSASHQRRVAVTAGAHVVKLQWRVEGGTGRIWVTTAPDAGHCASLMVREEMS